MHSLLHRGRVEDRFYPVDGVVRIFAKEKVSNRSGSRILFATAIRKIHLSTLAGIELG